MVIPNFFKIYTFWQIITFVSAIRGGHLDTFNEVLRQFGTKFIADETYSLIVRLRHNVIKTGVRQISLSYSRISLADIAHKLQLDSPEDAEYIVAKVRLIFWIFVGMYIVQSTLYIYICTLFKLYNCTCTLSYSRTLLIKIFTKLNLL